MLITADHGNAEQMEDAMTHQAHTAHTTNPVPLIYVGREAELDANGALCDIAPTLLKMMRLRKPVGNERAFIATVSGGELKLPGGVILRINAGSGGPLPPVAGRRTA